MPRQSRPTSPNDRAASAFEALAAHRQAWEAFSARHAAERDRERAVHLIEPARAALASGLSLRQTARLLGLSHASLGEALARATTSP